jgi:glycosyltransferase involved in cell wall biosynthesis
MQYFFDLTATANYLRSSPSFSGIQRAAVMLIEKAASQLGAEHVHIGLYDNTLGSYQTFPLAALAPGELTDAAAFRARLGYRERSAGVHPILNKYRDQSLKLSFHRLKFQVASLMGYDRPFTRKNITRAHWREHYQRQKKEERKLPLAPFDTVAQSGDQFVMLDGAYSGASSAETYRSIRDKGLSTWTLIHDLIPIVVPAVVEDLGPLTFYDGLLTSESYTDHYLTVSASAGHDLREFLTAHKIERPIKVVRLAQAPLPSKAGTDLGLLAAKVDRTLYSPVLDSSCVGDRIRSLSKFSFVLCVGTLEIRKNNWLLATAWDRLRQIKGLRLPKLVFAGRPGWLNDDFNRLMQATGQLGGWVEIVEGPSDKELEYLYQNCEFVAMPSLYEGWGLPVGEALSYGKTAVVSNTSSLPEVGLDLVEYCDPTSIDSIAEACLRLIADPDRRLALEQKIRESTLRSWDDVARDLVSAVLDD